MKVLIVASYNKSRFAPFIVEQASALRQLGCEVDWFGIKGKGLLGYLLAIPILRKKIKEWQPDIIHAHYGLSCLLANIAERNVPVVSTYHGSDINNGKVRLLSRMAMFLSAWNIFVSQCNVNRIKPRKNWSLIPCGIDMPIPWGKLCDMLIGEQTYSQFVSRVMDQNKFHILFAGAFDNAVKDSKLARKVVNVYNKSHPNKQAQLIELKGFSRNQVNALMYNSDVFLMTSKTEGSPQVIKEAMACGCPIVSVDVGDVKERIAGLEGCYLVSSREPESIAVALEKALMYNDRTEGYERVLRTGLTNQQIAQRIKDIYEILAYCC
jgi:glycosyltransferase involved in cell wall biosynthesis